MSTRLARLQRATILWHHQLEHHNVLAVRMVADPQVPMEEEEEPEPHRRTPVITKLQSGCNRTTMMHCGNASMLSDSWFNN